MIKEYFKIAIRSLKTRALRSWLTILGVVIGVFLIVVLLSLGGGMEQTMTQQLRMMGSDVITVLPGEITDLTTSMAGGLELGEQDIEAIEKTDGIQTAAPMMWKAEVIHCEQKKKTVLVYGLPWKNLDFFQEDMGWSLQQGRWPISGKREVVLGNFITEDIFPQAKVGSELHIAGRPFRVVGILQSLGNKQDDSMIGLDLEVFRRVTGERQGAQSVFAKVASGFSAEDVAENIKKNLQETRKRKRNEDLPSFSVLTSEKAGSIVSNIMNVVQAFVYGIASIAILVGGIGIMNTMYTSVRERMREVGIMKAVGAKNSTIVTLFLVESGIVGLVGGLGGLFFGLGLAKLVELFLQINPVFYLQASITPGIIIFGLVFSFGLGCLSGLLPARQAARLNPSDALRYE